MAATKMKLEDWLDDLCVRFINNLPEADLTSMARICFLVEEAHWFYEDFVRPLDPSLPSMNLRNFCLTIFQRCPLLAPFPIQDHIRAFEEFLKYKTSVPVRGAILLDETMEYALLVKGWKKGANWSFPKGKINMDEDDLDCAIREVAEETGFDIRVAGLVPPPDEVKFIESTFRDQQLRLYVFRGVSMDTYFEPKTRKEISKIQWYKISDLPTYRRKNNNDDDASGAQQQTAKFYMVAPFTGPLKKWVAHQRRRDAYRAGHTNLALQMPIAEEGLTEDEAGGQPEPSFEAYQNPPPEGLLDNATRELQRLLKMQPPSAAARPAQGYDYPDPSQDKANALLAVLQSGGEANQSSATRLHTPPEETTYGQAPRHMAQQGGYAGYQQQPAPQPPFHLQGQNMPGPQYGQYQQQQQQQQQKQQQQQQQPQPRPQYAPQMTQPAQVYGYQQQHQTQAPPQSQNPFAPNYVSKPQQPPYPYGQQQQQPPQISPRQQQPTSQPPIPLLHPQPLPPTVQKGLLARESFATPDVVGSTAARNYASLVGPPPPQHNNAQRPPLTSHAAALLNAFKSGSSSSNINNNNARQDAGQSAGSNRTWPQPSQPSHQSQQPQQSPQQHLPHQPPPPQNPQPYGNAAAQAHQLYGARPQPGPHPQQYGPAPPSAAFTGVTIPPSNGGYGYNGISGPQTQQQQQQQQQQQPIGLPMVTAPPFASRPGQPMDSHRSALLDMFKQPQPQPQPQQQEPAEMPAQMPAQMHPPQQTAAALRTMPPPQQQPVVEDMQASQSSSRYSDMSTGQAIEAAAQANGGPIEMHPDLNLPFGALSLLSRPKGGSVDGAVRQQPMPQQQQLSPPPPQQYSYIRGSRSIGGTPPVRGTPPMHGTPPIRGTPPVAVSDTLRGRQTFIQLNPQPQPQPQQGPYGNTGMASPGAEGGGPFNPQAAAAAAPAQAQAQAQGAIRRTEMTADHKQKLLSLFGKPQLSPTASVSSRGSLELRNRETAASSAAGLPSDASRRSSMQAASISPADRSFLLGYLASATKP